MRQSALVSALVFVVALTGRSAAEPGFDRYSYSNDAGTRTYKVYIPPSYSVLGPPLPLVVDLHGCGSDADEEARWSRFNDLAAARGFLVAYPEQSASANGGKCWNWFLPDHQSRDVGEAWYGGRRGEKVYVSAGRGASGARLLRLCVLP
ncbi:MAG: alpha/beta hydrolase family esterase [Candidatus Binatia bacterium]